ncbi:MAG: hypothetical protein H0T68_09640, partial [Gemmatimonadales bacterium]|nr:hypothetical protein [Gemmatimonadales bacterium]
GDPFRISEQTPFTAVMAPAAAVLLRALLAFAIPIWSATRRLVAVGFAV